MPLPSQKKLDLAGAGELGPDVAGARAQQGVAQDYVSLKKKAAQYADFSSDKYLDALMDASIEDAKAAGESDPDKVAATAQQIYDDRKARLKVRTGQLRGELEQLIPNLTPPEIGFNEQQSQAIKAGHSWRLTPDQAEQHAVKGAADLDEQIGILGFQGQHPKVVQAASQDRWDVGDTRPPGIFSKALDVLGVGGSAASSALEGGKRELLKNSEVNAPPSSAWISTRQFPQVQKMLESGGQAADQLDFAPLKKVGGAVGSALLAANPLAIGENARRATEAVMGGEEFEPAGSGVLGSLASLLPSAAASAAQKVGKEGISLGPEDARRNLAALKAANVGNPLAQGLLGLAQKPFEEDEPRYAGIPESALTPENMLAAAKGAGRELKNVFDVSGRTSSVAENVDIAKTKYKEAAVKQALGELGADANPQAVNSRAKEIYKRYLETDDQLTFDPAAVQLLQESVLDPTNVAPGLHPLALAGKGAGKLLGMGGRALAKTARAGAIAGELGQDLTTAQKAAQSVEKVGDFAANAFMHRPELAALEKAPGMEDLAHSMRIEQSAAQHAKQQFMVGAKDLIAHGRKLEDAMTPSELESVWAHVNGAPTALSERGQQLIEEFQIPLQRHHEEGRQALGLNRDFDNKTGALRESQNRAGFYVPLRKPKNVATPEEAELALSTATGAKSNASLVDSLASSKQRTANRWQDAEPSLVEQWTSEYKKVAGTIAENLEMRGIGEAVERAGGIKTFQKPIPKELARAVGRTETRLNTLEGRWVKRQAKREELIAEVAERENKIAALENFAKTGRPLDPQVFDMAATAREAEIETFRPLADLHSIAADAEAIARQAGKTSAARKAEAARLELEGLISAGHEFRPKDAERIQQLKAETLQLREAAQQAVESNQSLQAAVKRVPFVMDAAGAPRLDRTGGVGLQLLRDDLTRAKQSLATFDKSLGALFKNKGTAAKTLEELKTQLVRNQTLEAEAIGAKKFLEKQTGLEWVYLDSWEKGKDAFRHLGSKGILQPGDAFRRTFGKPGEVFKGQHLSLVPRPVADRIQALSTIPGITSNAVADTKHGFSKAAGEIWNGLANHLLRPIQSVWRVNKMMAPVSVLRNAFGAPALIALNAGIHGLDPAVSIRGLQVAMMAEGELRDFVLKNVKFADKTGAQVDLANAIKLLDRSGITQQGNLKAGMHEGAGILEKGARKYTDALWGRLLGIPGTEGISAAGLNTKFDNWAKYSTYLNFLRQDASEKGIRRAIDLTAKYAGDYNRMGQLEKAALRDTIGFYSFQRFIVPRVVRALWESPTRLANIDRFHQFLQNRYGRMTPTMLEEMASYQQGLGFPAPPELQPKDPDHKTIGTLEPSVLTMAGPTIRMLLGQGNDETAVDQLGPIAKLVAEMILQRDLKTGQPLTAWAPNTQDIYRVAAGQQPSSIGGNAAYDLVQRPFEGIRNIYNLFEDNGAPGAAADFALRMAAGRFWVGLDQLTGKGASLGGPLETGLPITYTVNQPETVQQRGAGPVKERAKAVR